MAKRRIVGFYKDERKRTRPITARRIRIRVGPTTYRWKGRLIHRQGYTYMREDVGAPGRTPESRRVIPPLQEGELSKHLPAKYQGKPFFEVPTRARHNAYRKSVAEDGYDSTRGRLMALYVLNKRTNPEVARKARRDFNWVVKTFGKS
jgi:hypothetical protein